MIEFDFNNGLRFPGRVRFESPEGIELVVHGPDDRVTLAKAVAKELPEVTRKGTELLKAFLKTPGVFQIESIKVMEQKTPESGDFSITMSCDSDESYDSTSYIVDFFDHAVDVLGVQRFHPFKFTVVCG